MNTLKKLSVSALVLGFLLSPISFISAEDAESGNENPVETLLLDTQTTSSLENVDFVMQVSPQRVQINTVVDYYFQIQNNGSSAIENARLTHVLPRGIQFIDFEFPESNVSIETTNYPNDTLIVRGLYLSANMNEAFILRAQALVGDLSSEGELMNQAVLDIINSDGQDSVLSDSNPQTENIEEKTVLIIETQDNNSSLTVSQQTTLNTQKVNPVILKASSGSGKKGLMWAGMRRDEILKSKATAEQMKAFSDRINNGRKAEIKTYIDRSGKVKFYGIIPGKLPASRFATAKKSRPTYRLASKVPAKVQRNSLKIKSGISRESKVRQYQTNFIKPRTTKRGVFRGNK